MTKKQIREASPPEVSAVARSQRCLHSVMTSDRLAGSGKHDETGAMRRFQHMINDKKASVCQRRTAQHAEGGHTLPEEQAQACATRFEVNALRSTSGGGGPSYLSDSRSLSLLTTSGKKTKNKKKKPPVNLICEAHISKVCCCVYSSVMVTV